MRQQTLQLVSELNRWCQVREDLLYAFQKALDSGIQEPMRGAVDQFVTRVKGGMAVDEALHHFEKSLDHEHFQDLLAAIRFNFRYRGNLPMLLTHLEWQMNRIEEEHTRRRLSHARDRRWTVAILTTVPLICLIRLLAYPAARAVFLTEPAGRVLLAVGCVFYAAAVLGYRAIAKKSGS